MSQMETAQSKSLEETRTKTLKENLIGYLYDLADVATGRNKLSWKRFYMKMDMELRKLKQARLTPFIRPIWCSNA